MRRTKGSRSGASSPAELDHYQLLQLDPDAPQDVIIEAYWYVAEKLRAQAAIRHVEEELEALNSAYAELIVPERRRHYDAAVSRVAQLRRERARQQPPERTRPPFFPTKKRPNRNNDYYGMLAVDPRAEPELIRRAYTVLRTLQRDGGEAKWRYRPAELDEAFAILMDERRRAEYDQRLRDKPEARSQDGRSQSGKRPARRARVKKGALRPEDAPGASVTTSPALQLPSLRPLGRALLASGRGLLLSLAFVGSALRHLAMVTGRGAIRVSTALVENAGEAVSHWRASEAPGRAVPDLPDRRVLADLPVSHQTRKPVATFPALARLLIEDSRGSTKTITMGDAPLVIGADPGCDVTLPVEDGAVASQHAQISLAAGRFIVRSLSPAHHTLIDGNNVNWAMLEDGDEIKIGRCRLRFTVLSPDGSPADHQAGPEDCNAPS
ncbi:MAG: FHA domain-containing protein [Dehalococcoidia bacterium]|nr:FHA domain-containing protein [Dehalococcoidia bacterium]